MHWDDFFHYLISLGRTPEEAEVEWLAHLEPPPGEPPEETPDAR